MTVHRVCLNADVYLSCVFHALSTESEEVMGLLIGEISEHQEKRVSNISGVIMLCRSDKQTDRVEISPEQLSNAASQAEVLILVVDYFLSIRGPSFGKHVLTKELERPMRVLGWYHSHPHITVWPSHVDVRTQAMYQTMDDGFIGLIFSVFNEDKSTKINRIQVTCFQSLNQSSRFDPSEYISVQVPMFVCPSPQISRLCYQSLVNLSSILRREEFEALTKVSQLHSNTKALSDVLVTLHNSAVYTKALCNIIEVNGLPLLTALDLRIQNNKRLINQLKDERDKLLKALNCKQGNQ